MPYNIAYLSLFLSATNPTASYSHVRNSRVVAHGALCLLYTKRLVSHDSLLLSFSPGRSLAACVTIEHYILIITLVNVSVVKGIIFIYC